MLILISGILNHPWDSPGAPSIEVERFGKTYGGMKFNEAANCRCPLTLEGNMMAGDGGFEPPSPAQKAGRISRLP